MSAPQSLDLGRPIRKTPWPHAPTHQLSQSGTYFVTVGTYRKQQHFRAADRLCVLHGELLAVSTSLTGSWKPGQYSRTIITSLFILQLAN